MKEISLNDVVQDFSIDYGLSEMKDMGLVNTLAENILPVIL